MSEGSFLIFLVRPISAILIGAALVLIIASILSHLRRGTRRHEEVRRKVPGAGQEVVERA